MLALITSRGCVCANRLATVGVVPVAMLRQFVVRPPAALCPLPFASLAFVP